MRVSKEKTKLTTTQDGFDFLGWNFIVQRNNNKFRCYPSKDNYRKVIGKIKDIVNNSNYGAEVKAVKLAPIVRGWRNYHKHCCMDGYTLWSANHRAWKVFNKEKNQTKHSVNKLITKAFPSVKYSENKFVMVSGDKSPYNGDTVYWSKRNSKLYDGHTAKMLNKQDHSCGHCGMKFIDGEKVNLHHIDGNHNNWRDDNLMAVHESCHDYIHMSKKGTKP